MLSRMLRQVIVFVTSHDYIAISERNWRWRRPQTECRSRVTATLGLSLAKPSESLTQTQLNYHRMQNTQYLLLESGLCLIQL